MHASAGSCARHRALGTVAPVCIARAPALPAAPSGWEGRVGLGGVQNFVPGAQVYEKRWNDENDRITAARLRNELRRIDGQIAHIHAEQRLFRRYQFGSDVHQIQLTGLNAERKDLVARLERLQPATLRRGARGGGFVSWLLVPPALGVLLFRSLFASEPTAQPLPRRRSARWARPMAG